MLVILIIIILALFLFGGGLGYSSRNYTAPGVLWFIAILLIILWLAGALRF